MQTGQMIVELAEDGSVYLPTILDFDFPDVEEGSYDETRATVETMDGGELTIRIPISREALAKLLAAIPVALKRGR